MEKLLNPLRLKAFQSGDWIKHHKGLRAHNNKQLTGKATKKQHKGTLTMETILIPFFIFSWGVHPPAREWL